MKTIIFIFIFALVPAAHAIKTVTIKGNRVLMDLEGENVSVGTKVGARDSNGKLRAILEIKQVKDGKAVAAVLKGQMQNGYSLATAKASSGKSASRGAVRSKSNDRAGIMAGYSMNTMTVKPSSTTSIELSGNSFALSGLYQMPIGSGFSARILGSYETLKASGTSASGPCGTCEVDIGYVGIEALGRYSFIESNSMDLWAGAGLGFLFAVSKSSNILDTSKISTNQTIVGALGLDYHLSPTTFIPIQFDYAMYPDNATSSASQMILRFGYGFTW